MNLFNLSIMIIMVVFIGFLDSLMAGLKKGKVTISEEIVRGACIKYN